MNNDFENLTNPTKLHKDTYKERICYCGHIIELNRDGFITNIIEARGSNVSCADLWLMKYSCDMTNTPFDRNLLKRAFVTINIEDNINE